MPLSRLFIKFPIIGIIRRFADVFKRSSTDIRSFNRSSQESDRAAISFFFITGGFVSFPSFIAGPWYLHGLFIYLSGSREFHDPFYRELYCFRYRATGRLIPRLPCKLKTGTGLKSTV